MAPPGGSCVAYDCDSRSHQKSKNQMFLEQGDKVSLHTFPRKPALREAWVRAVNRKNFVPSNSSRLCSRHFDASCFVKKGAQIRLKEGSVPTIFSVMPEFYQQTAQFVENVEIENVSCSADHHGKISEVFPESSKSTSTLQSAPPADNEASSPLSFTMETVELTADLVQEDNVHVETQKSSDLIEVSQVSSMTSPMRTEKAQVMTTPITPSPSTSDRLAKKRIISSVISGSTTSSQLMAEDITDLTPRSKRSKLNERLLNITPVKKAIGSLKEEKNRVMKQKKVAQRKCQRAKKKIKSLSDVINELKNNNFLSTEMAEVFTSTFGPHKELINRMLSMTTKKNKPRMKRKYGIEIRTFSLTLHYYSPKAYEFVRNSFWKALPHPKTLVKWYISIEGKPGFTREALESLSVLSSQKEEPLLCSMVIDEMSIREKLEYDGHITHGYVDWGSDMPVDDMTPANQAFVIMLVCVNGSWRVPIGYFLVTSLTAEQKANLVKQALIMSHDIGKVKVISLCFDGISSNISMVKILGGSLDADNIKHHFQHPATKEKVFVYPDPCHMLKLVRNCLGEKGGFVNNQNEWILWEYLKKVNNLQEEEGFHLGNKLRRKHINFQRQKMKVNLASQALSLSTADSLVFCRDVLKLKAFESCEATNVFIRNINNLFDILNSRRLTQKGFKHPLDLMNFEKNKDVILSIRDYLLTLKETPDGRSMTHGSRKTGFLGFITDIMSCIDIFETYVVNGPLKFLPTYKLNQDHLELFFGLVRSRGGFNNNPSARQFKAAYKRLLVHMQLTASRTGNCMPLENLTILSCSSAVQNINLSSNSVGMDDCEDIDDDLEEISTDHDYDAFPYSETSEYAHYVIQYIAGFIGGKLSKKLKCAPCTHALRGERRNLPLIEVKDKGGLFYPSEDVIKICGLSDKYIRHVQAYNGGILPRKFNEHQCSIEVLREVGEDCFSVLYEHAYEQDPLFCHRLNLIKAVSSFYCKIKIHKINMTTGPSSRQFLNKITLFRGQ